MIPAFRELELPSDVRGRVYLASMPGRYEHLADALAEMDRRSIHRIVCLTPDDEIESKAPEYARALRNGDVGRTCERLDIADYRAPAGGEAFRGLVSRVGSRVRDGEHVLVHCAGGIGRTSTFAVCLLVGLGWSLDRARDAVARAGSRPESDAQNAFIRTFADDAMAAAARGDHA
jgi:hypothetical protein